MERFICIHGHFYQPPRENPWLESIELQDSAYPYHDWNERITAECYAPNSVARILDDQNQIVQLVNNYSKISFNFGPTLLSWLADQSSETYQAILEADRQSIENFSGHGSALAQAYNHVILPLANHQDRVTQVLWGIRDFEHRFRRAPEGMWLPETAVDLATLEILAEFGIRFTILAPHQAARVREIGTRAWHDVRGAKIDPTRAYEVRLASGRSIAVFFYNGPIARAVAFEGLLSRGEHFAEALAGAFTANNSWPQLVHIATDGESYGHHHRYGDMALASALKHIEAHRLARLTNYGEYLERHPAMHEVEIFDKSSWSCFHGIDRWWSNCGCNSGGHRDWNQEWRTPLRNALDWLRDSLIKRFEVLGREIFKDPWAARNDYIAVINNRQDDSIEKFFARHSISTLGHNSQTTALKLMELQRHAMLMFTSCGWFFDDLSGIETVQIIQYGGRAVQLGEELFGESLEAEFVERLSKAKSNVQERGDGREIYEASVRPAMVNWRRIGAHYAVRSLFETYPQETNIYCYQARTKDHRSFAAGTAQLAIGKVHLTSEITHESALLDFVVMHTSDHHINGGAQESTSPDLYEKLTAKVIEPFLRGDLAEVIRSMDRVFDGSNYSLKSLFLEEQRTVLRKILAPDLKHAETVYRQLYNHNAPILRYLTTLHVLLPKPFSAAAELVLNSNLKLALEEPHVDRHRVVDLLSAAKLEGVALDHSMLELAYRHNLDSRAQSLLTTPTHFCLQELNNLTGLLSVLPFSVSLWTAQNIFCKLLQTLYPEMLKRTAKGDAAALAWISDFEELGQKLGVKTHV